MTVKKRLRKSYLRMFLIPMLSATLLLVLGAGIALFILEVKYLPRLGLSLGELHTVLESFESQLQSFEMFVWIYVGAVGMALVITIIVTNLILTRKLFSHIAEPLDALVDGVDRIRAGDLDNPINYKEADEFKPACDAVDLMAAKLKASLEAEQRRQQSSRELIAGMSHDLKSPLTSIRAYTEALREGVAETPEMRERYFRTICAKESEMERMLARLLEFSKLELSEYPAKNESFDIKPELETILGEIFPGAAEINTERISSMPVSADREQLRRIAENVIGNSIKYCGEGVKVYVSTQSVDGLVRIKFADNGKGVPDEALPKLFDLFYRTDPARAETGSGSGLGLAIVRRAAEQMGGRAYAEKSELGGLCIVIDLPGGTLDG